MSSPANANAAEITTAFVLALRLPGEAVPGLLPGVWWIVGRDGQESAARQRAFKMMPLARSLGGEAVLMYLVQDGFGRALESRIVIRQLNGTRPPQPNDFRHPTMAALAALQARLAGGQAEGALRFAPARGSLLKGFWSAR